MFGFPSRRDHVEFDALTLNVKYDDAFVAYLNGRPIAAAGGPDAAEAAWNSVAAQRSDRSSRRWPV